MLDWADMHFAYIYSAESQLKDSQSFDLGMMLHQRDRRRATHLFKKTPSLSKSNSIDQSDEVELGQWEPDWTKFESIYARGMYAGVVTFSDLLIKGFFNVHLDHDPTDSLDSSLF